MSVILYYLVKHLQMYLEILHYDGVCSRLQGQEKTDTSILFVLQIYIMTFLNDL